MAEGGDAAAGSATSSGATTAAAFYEQFRKAKADILAELNQPGPPSPDTTKNLARLRGDLQQILADLPAYDQRQYDLQLRELETKLSAKRAKDRPKSKFSFNKPSASTKAPLDRPQSGANGPASVNAQSLQASSSTINHSKELDPEAGPSRPHALTKRSRKWFTLDDLDISNSSSWTISLEDLQECIVDLSSDTNGLTSLHGRKLRRCIILAERVSGSVLLHDLHDCFVIASAHQFRIHTSSNCDIHLHVTSVPVIEHCSRMRFHPPPISPADHSATNRCRDVADFSWMKDAPSPNWSYIDTTLDDGLMSSFGSKQDGQLDKILVSFMPPPVVR